MKKFYYKNVDKRSYKKMYNFLKNHDCYFTMNSWNRLKSICNNVKLYNMDLSGNPWEVLKFLNDRSDFIGIQEKIQDLIYNFNYNFKNFSVYQNGRSGGYLVLYNKNNNDGVLPDVIVDTSNYEEFKKEIIYCYGSLKNYKSDLLYYVDVVQEFDRLCDEIRAEINSVSMLKYNHEFINYMIEEFNNIYYEEMELLKIQLLKIEDNKINIEEVKLYKSLYNQLMDYLKNDYVKIKIENNYLYIMED